MSRTLPTHFENVYFLSSSTSTKSGTPSFSYQKNIEKMKLLLLIFLIKVSFAKKEGCSGGALFLSLESSATYSSPFQYDCTEGHLQKVLKNLKKRNSDPFVSYYLKKVKRNVEDEEEDDYESGDFEDDDEEEEEVDEPVDNVVNEIEPSVVKNEFGWVEPTPEIKVPFSSVVVTPPSSSHSHVVSSSYSSAIVPTPSSSIAVHHSITAPLQSSVLPSFFGSGDGDFEERNLEPSPSSTATPSTTTSTSTTAPTPTKRMLKHPKIGLQSGTSSVLPIEESCKEIVPKLEWVELESSRGESRVTALPRTKDISEWEVRVSCLKHDYELFYSVRQRQKSRLWNHFFRVEFVTMDRSVGGLNKFIEKTFGKNLVVHDWGLEEVPFFVEFVNESLVGGEHGCPSEKLTSFLQELKSKNSSSHIVKSVTLKAHPPLCNPQDFKTADPSPPARKNYPPSIKNQIDEIDTKAGRFLNYKIKADFCYDPEEGDTTNLKLSLKNLKTHEALGEDSWLQFDDKNGEIYGLPMKPAREEVVVVCTDSGGQAARDSSTITVTNDTQSYSALLTLHFKSIPFKPLNIRKFIQKLSAILSDEIQVKSFSESNNHVVFSWYNTSNPSTETQLNEIRKLIWSDEGGVKKEVKSVFSPEFNLSDSGGIVPVGGWLMGSGTPVEVFDFDGGDKGGGIGGGIEDEDVVKGLDNNVLIGRGEEGFGSGFSVDGTYLTTYILPSALITLMILLSLIIACLLSRKKQPDDFFEKPQKLLSNPPVIFQEELEQEVLNKRQDQMAAPQPPSYRSQYSAMPMMAAPAATTAPNYYHTHQHHPTTSQYRSYAKPPSLNYNTGGNGNGMRSVKMYSTGTYVPP